MHSTILRKLVTTCLFLSVLVLGLTSCDEEEGEPEGPSITGFTPTVGLPGTVVTISGKNFDATPTNNTVKFSNILVTVNEATTTSLKVVVPADVVTGKIEVIVNNKSAISATDFVVPPVITDFTPKSGIAGATISITGKGFSTTLANNVVKINGVSATVTAATATSLTIQAPQNGFSGTISVDVGGANAVTTDVFKYLPVITTFEPAEGPVGSNVTISGSGFNQDPDENLVKIGDIEAEVVSGTANQLVIKVPEGAVTAVITVSSEGSIATSSTPFVVIVEAWRAGGANFDSGFSIGVDGTGNSYVAGSFMGTASFESTELTAEGEEIFVAKYDQEGKLVWAISAGGSADDRAASIAVDGAGNSYIAGYFGETADFGSLSSGSVGGSDAFVAKINTAGEFQWVETFGSSNTDNASSLALDSDGNVVVTGQFFSTVNVGGTNITSEGNSSVFVAKFEKNSGNTIWAKNFGGSMDDSGVAISASSDGDIYVGADFFGTVTVGPFAFTAGTNALNSYVLKLNDLGAILWAKHIFGNDWNNVLGIASDAAGNCIVTGYFITNAVIGSTTLNAAGNEDIFLVKLKSADGDVIFAKTAGGADYDNGKGLAVDSNGNIYLTGHFAREATFGNSTLDSKNNSRDAFVAKYEPDGDFVWVEGMGGDESDDGYGVCVGDTGIIYITGSYRDGPGRFGATILDNDGSDDVFVYRITP